MNTRKTSATAAKGQSIVTEQASQRALSKANFTIIIAAGIMIVLGFILMLGGSSTPEQFNPDIFSTRRIVVGPLIAFLGFVVMGVGIIINPDRFDKSRRTANKAGGDK